MREDGVRGGGLVDSGTVVMNNGEELDSMNVIINGKVRVEGPSRQGSRKCGSLAAGLPGPFFWQALFYELTQIFLAGTLLFYPLVNIVRPC